MNIIGQTNYDGIDYNIVQGQDGKVYIVSQDGQSWYPAQLGENGSYEIAFQSQDKFGDQDLTNALTQRVETTTMEPYTTTVTKYRSTSPLSLDGSAHYELTSLTPFLKLQMVHAYRNLSKSRAAGKLGWLQDILGKYDRRTIKDITEDDRLTLLELLGAEGVVPAVRSDLRTLISPDMLHLVKVSGQQTLSDKSVGSSYSLGTACPTCNQHGNSGINNRKSLYTWTPGHLEVNKNDAVKEYLELTTEFHPSTVSELYYALPALPTIEEQVVYDEGEQAVPKPTIRKKSNSTKKVNTSKNIHKPVKRPTAVSGGHTQHRSVNPDGSVSEWQKLGGIINYLSYFE